MELFNIEKVTKKQLISSFEEITAKNFLDENGELISYDTKSLNKAKKDELALEFVNVIGDIRFIRVNGTAKSVTVADISGKEVEGYKNVEEAKLSDETLDRYMTLQTKEEEGTAKEVETPVTKEPKEEKAAKPPKEKKEKVKKEKPFSINRNEAVILAMLEMESFKGPEDLGETVQRIFTTVNKNREGSLKEAIAQAKKGINYLFATNWLRKEGDKYVVVDKANVQKILQDEK